MANLCLPSPQLCFAGLGVLVLRGGSFHQGAIEVELQALASFRNFRLLVIRDQQTRAVSMWVGVVSPDQEMGLLWCKRGRKEYGWDPNHPSGYILEPLCPTVMVNGYTANWFKALGTGVWIQQRFKVRVISSRMERGRGSTDICYRFEIRCHSGEGYFIPPFIKLLTCRQAHRNPGIAAPRVCLKNTMTFPSL